MNSPDIGIDRPKKLERKRAEGRPKEHGPSSSDSEGSLQDTPGQTDTCGKVSLDYVEYHANVNCIFT